jgi:integrase
MKLTARQVRTLAKPGLYGDGGNLYLQVRGPEQRSWVFRYMIGGKARSMGLGVPPEVSLVEARNRADEARRLVRDGIDPITRREAARAADAAAKARAITFKECTDRYIAAHRTVWKNQRHRHDWQTSVATYAEPVLGKLPVEAIDTVLVLRVLEPIWLTKTETASRVRGRIEMILSYATALGLRDGPNPAVWRGHLQLILPSRAKVRPRVHLAALDWREAPDFMAKLREQDNIGAKALQFAILTAARSGEVRGATWDEINMEEATWTIPAQRMKAGREHRVPLSKPALAVLQSLDLLRTNTGPVFPGQKLKRPLTDMGLTRPLDRMGRSDLTVHGFRSTFRDWAAETTGYPNHVVEQALAHAIGSAIEAAYRRGDLFTKRIALMNEWANYLERPQAKIVPLHPKQSQKPLRGSKPVTAAI